MEASGGENTGNPWDKAKGKHVSLTHDAGDQIPKQRSTNEEDEQIEPNVASTEHENEENEGDEQKGTNDDEAGGQAEAGATPTREGGPDAEDIGAHCFSNYRHPHHTDQREPYSDEVGRGRPVEWNPGRRSLEPRPTESWSPQSP